MIQYFLGFLTASVIFFLHFRKARSIVFMALDEAARKKGYLSPWHAAALAQEFYLRRE